MDNHPRITGRPLQRSKQRSVDRLSDKENSSKMSSRPNASPSPYSSHYRSTVTHDQRALISQRTHVTKLHRIDLEDRYLSLLDEHFALKKENVANHDKIRKLITKVMRLSNDNGSRLNLASSKQHISNDEDLHLRILDLESYNAQLRDRLSNMIRCGSSNSRSRCPSVTTFRGSSANSMARNKMKNFQSQETLFRIDQFDPDDCTARSNTASTNKTQDNKNTNRDIAESDSHPSGLDLQVQEDEIAELKAIIEQLKLELSTKSMDYPVVTSFSASNSLLEEVDKIEQQLNRREEELMTREKKLKAEMQNLRNTNQKELEKKSQKINEITSILDREICRNKVLFEEKEQLESELLLARQGSDDVVDILAENQLLKAHRDNITSLANELAARTERIAILRRDHATTRSLLTTAKTELETAQLCHADMLQKIQQLQDANDELSVSIEGLRAECDSLREANYQLTTENHKLTNI